VTVIAAMAHSPEAQARIDAGEALTRQRRLAAAHSPLLDRDEIALHLAAGTAKNCARCTHIGDFRADQQRGWCMWLRHMVSTWHPCRCNAFHVEQP
jgi:hypothetical protein